MWKTVIKYRRINKNTWKSDMDVECTNKEMFDMIVKDYYSYIHYKNGFIQIVDDNLKRIKLKSKDELYLNSLRIADGTLYNKILKSTGIMTTYTLFNYSCVILETYHYKNKKKLIQAITDNINKELNYMRVLDIYNGYLYYENDLNIFISPNSKIDRPKLGTTPIYNRDSEVAYMITLEYKGNRCNDVQILCDSNYMIVGVYTKEDGMTSIDISSKEPK